MGQDIVKLEDTVQPSSTDIDTHSTVINSAKKLLLGHLDVLSNRLTFLETTTSSSSDAPADQFPLDDRRRAISALATAQESFRFQWWENTEHVGLVESAGLRKHCS